MQYALNTHDTHSLAHITYSGEPIAYAAISVDIHTVNSASREAIEHIYEHALLAGAGTLSREQFLDAINLLGAEIHVSLSNGKCTITLKSTATVFKKALALVATMIGAPRFENSELTRIKTLVQNTLTEYDEDARANALDGFVNELYKPTDRRHRYSTVTLRKHLATVTKDDLRKLHQTVQQGFWCASVAGNRTTIAAFEKTITTLRAQYPLTTTTGTHTPLTPVATMVLKNIPSKHNIEYSIGGPLPLTLHHPDYLPFIFGLNVLGKWGGFAGRLMSTVREKEGLTYGIYARTETVNGSETGFWRIMTFFAPEKSLQGLTSTVREITKIHKKGITPHEFTRFKTISNTQESLLLDSVTSALSDLHAYHVAGFTLEEMRAHKERLTGVTRAEVNKALATYLHPKALVISGAGPVTAVAPALKRFVKQAASKHT